MSMIRFSETIAFAMKVPMTDRDVEETLQVLHQISQQYHEDDENLQDFFKHAQPSIQYLFFLDQNTDNKYCAEPLSDIFDQFEELQEHSREQARAHRQCERGNGSYLSVDRERDASQCSSDSECMRISYETECLL